MSCQEDREVNEKTPADVEGGSKQMVLGVQKENPYALETMQMVLDTIIKAKAADNPNLRTAEIILETTDLYVRFLPSNEDQLNALQQDSMLIFFDHPLDYEIEQKGDYYLDPSIEEGGITWQYTVVKPGYNFPDTIQYEILSELFIPENSPLFIENPSEEETGANSRVMATAPISLNELELSALYITGNLSEKELEDLERGRNASPNSRGQKCIGRSWYRVCWYEPDPWKAVGSIKVYDDVHKKYIPVKGARVRVWRWFNVHEVYTDDNGNFEAGEFIHEAQYEVIWERYHYAIKAGKFSEIPFGYYPPAKMMGPRSKGRWDRLIYDNDIQQFYAITHLAALRYYYGLDIRGLKRPPLRMWRKPQMQIVAFDKSGGAAHTKDARLLGRWLSVYRYEDHKFLGVSKMYYNTIHELAHASHWEERKNKWHFQTSSKLKESWGLAIGWYFTTDIYPKSSFGTESYIDATFSFMKGENGKEKYTSLIVDLEDKTDQSLRSSDHAIDSVSAYTLKQVENELKNCGNIMDLKNLLYEHYPSNPTRHHLNYLFEQYENLSR